MILVALMRRKSARSGIHPTARNRSTSCLSCTRMTFRRSTTTFITVRGVTQMIRIIKVLLVMASIAGYAYISNQDFEDQKKAEAVR